MVLDCLYLVSLQVARVAEEELYFVKVSKVAFQQSITKSKVKKNI